MKAPRWIWPLNTVGAIAVANLACFGLCGVLHLLLFPSGFVRVDLEPPWKLAVDDVLWLLVLALTFPVGWLSDLGSPGISGPPFLAVVFVPINACAWGWYGKSLWSRHEQNTGWVFRFVGCLLAVVAALLVIVALSWLL
ncbi:MAG: hypothetical protein ACKV0T_19955 [Planctomycetales bacterium]